MARQDRDPQTWTSLRCVKCAGASAQPFRTTAVNSQLIQVEIRCPDCHHQWQLARSASDELPPVMELARLQAPQIIRWG